MSTMGERVLNRTEIFGSFGSFQGANSGRTLSVFCQNLPLALGVGTVGEVSNCKWKEEEEVFNSTKV